MSKLSLPDGVRILGPVSEAGAAILSPEALDFVADLARTFWPEVEARLMARKERHAAYAAGERPRFLPETRAVREGDWKVAPLPEDLLDRRVEITGPVDRKMIINALNSGANVLHGRLRGLELADVGQPAYEGQIHLRDADARHHRSPSRTRREEQAATSSATIRRCSWFAPARLAPVGEAPAWSTTSPVPAGLFDFGLYFFHNAKALLRQNGSGPLLLPAQAARATSRRACGTTVFVQGAAVHARRAPTAASRPRC